MKYVSSRFLSVVIFISIASPLLYFGGSNTVNDHQYNQQNSFAFHTPPDQAFTGEDTTFCGNFREENCQFDTLACDPLEKMNGTDRDDNASSLTSPTEANKTPSSYRPTIASFYEDDEVGQTVTFHGSSDTTFLGPQGTLISIPAHAFVNSAGKSVQGPITFTYRELYNKSSMVMANKPTMAQGRMLKTGGSLYMNATANGQSLELQDNKSIYVEFNSPDPSPGMRLFNGTQNQRGNFTWQADTTQSRWVFSLPWKVLQLPDNHPIDEEDDDIVGTFHLSDTAYQGSLLWTREFERRWKMMDRLPKKKDEILQFYKSHFGEPLFMADQSAVNYLTLTCNYDKKNRNKKWWLLRNLYLKHMKRQKGEPVPLDQYDFSGNDAEARKRLIKRHNMSSQKARRLVRLNDIRDRIIQRRRQQIAANKVDSFTANAFQVNNLGWINCDEFYNIEEQKQDLLVKIEGPVNRHTNVFLVFNSINSVMRAQGYQGGGYFMFTGLPQTWRGKLVAISADGKVTYLGTRPIKLEGQREVTIKIDKTEQESLQKTLSARL